MNRTYDLRNAGSLTRNFSSPITKQRSVHQFTHGCINVSLIETLGGLGEFSTVMQTRDEVEGLHNCLEFSQPLSCLYQAMQTRKTFSIA